MKHKFRAKPTTRNGVRYDSQLEARYAAKLDLAQKTGELVFYLRQVPFDLNGGVKYRADFVEFWADGEVRVVDVKGYDTPQSRQKRKQVEAIYPIEIHLVTKV